MKITKIALSDLTLNPKNVRTHSEKQINEYKRSVKKFGQTKPIVCDENHVILIGNGLYLAMKALDMKEADCFVRTGLSEKDKLKLMMADNKVYELGVTDMSAIDEIVAALDGDFDIPGYDDDLLEMLQMSAREATDLVMEYGKVDVPETKPAEEPKFMTSDQLGGQNPYSEAQNPQMVQHDESAGNTQPGKFLICPKCGERIWL